MALNAHMSVLFGPCCLEVNANWHESKDEDGIFLSSSLA
jgi:hypothetical protein